MHAYHDILTYTELSYFLNPLLHVDGEKIRLLQSSRDTILTQLRDVFHHLNNWSQPLQLVNVPACNSFQFLELTCNSC